MISAHLKSAKKGKQVWQLLLGANIAGEGGIFYYCYSLLGADLVEVLLFETGY